MTIATIVGFIAMSGSVQAAKGPISDKSSFDIVYEMEVGWNLGNALDVPSTNEEEWGNPRATKAMVDGVRAKGFKTLRVPVTWGPHIGAGPAYTIDKKWLDRVEEVVNYGLSNDMYVIMDVHHDDDWIRPSYKEVDASIKKLEKVWRQIALRFKPYNERLIFETINEPRLKGSPMEWGGGDAEGRDCVNQLHAAALKQIRSTGGNNATRQVMIAPYGAAWYAADGFKLPEDDENLIVSIHMYNPYDFCMKPMNQGGRNYLTEDDKWGLYWELDELCKMWVDKGVPVVIGEWGSMHRSNTAEREKHAKMYADACMKRVIPCVVWDDGNNSTAFGIYNRRACNWWYSTLAQNIVDGVKQKPVVGLDDVTTTKIVVVPNPATTYITLNGASDAPYQIRSAAGLLVLSAESYDGGAIAISSLTPGIYFLTIDGHTMTFIKE